MDSLWPEMGDAQGTSEVNYTPCLDLTDSFAAPQHDSQQHVIPIQSEVDYYMCCVLLSLA